MSNLNFGAKWYNGCLVVVCCANNLFDIVLAIMVEDDHMICGVTTFELQQMAMTMSMGMHPVIGVQSPVSIISQYELQEIMQCMLSGHHWTHAYIGTGMEDFTEEVLSTNKRIANNIGLLPTNLYGNINMADGLAHVWQVKIMKMPKWIVYGISVPVKGSSTCLVHKPKVGQVLTVQTTNKQYHFRCHTNEYKGKFDKNSLLTF